MAILAPLLLLVLFAIIDYAFQWWQYRKKLKMSTQEVKDEYKQLEGDPQHKRRQRSMQMEMSRNRMMTDVQSADVVVTNPTHYAVALKWSRTKGSAPSCVAKGEGEIALRIREIAGDSGIPIHSDPPTARALHATVEIGAEIPPEQYKAVAAAIRFADRMRAAAKGRMV